jgi:hypothetical protein
LFSTDTDRPHLRELAVELGIEQPPRESFLPDERPRDVSMRMRPMIDNAMIPKIRPTSRMLSRMSPLRMWLNS